MITLQIVLSDDQAVLLRRLVGTPAVPLPGGYLPNAQSVDDQGVHDVVTYLIAAITDGIRRPGSWERNVVDTLFGDIR